MEDFNGYLLMFCIVAFTLATSLIFFVERKSTHGVSFGEQKSKTKHMDDIL